MHHSLAYSLLKVGCVCPRDDGEHDVGSQHTCDGVGIAVPQAARLLKVDARQEDEVGDAPWDKQLAQREVYIGHRSLEHQTGTRTEHHGAQHEDECHDDDIEYEVNEIHWCHLQVTFMGDVWPAPKTMQRYLKGVYAPKNTVRLLQFLRFCNRRTTFYDKMGDLLRLRCLVFKRE